MIGVSGNAPWDWRVVAESKVVGPVLFIKREVTVRGTWNSTPPPVRVPSKNVGPEPPMIAACGADIKNIFDVNVALDRKAHPITEADSIIEVDWVGDDGGEELEHCAAGRDINRCHTLEGVEHHQGKPD